MRAGKRMRFRKTIWLPLLLAVVILFSGCGAKLPEHAVTEELLVTLRNTEFTAPKNIIYMIGDGMGENIIQATRAKYADSLYESKLAIEYLERLGTQSTYSATDKVTDSSAGGTALATGKKTSNYTIAMNTDDTESYKTLLELAAEKGKSTGIIATKSVTDATPAAFTAHVEHRRLQNDIAKQQLQKIADGTLDLVLGGGTEYYEFSLNKEAFREAEAKGMSYSTNWNETQKDQLPLVGLYANDALFTDEDSTPTVAEMTEFALKKLAEDENGFFLMVEGSQIDTMAHDNELEKEMYEMYQFDCAIAVAMQFIAEHPDTVLIVTADHETGGLYFPEGGYEVGSHVYLYDDHSHINVPVFGLGYGLEKLSGVMENTDIAQFLASVMGEEHFGQDSVVTKIHDGETEGTIELAFHADTPANELFTENFSAKTGLMKNVRALHFTVENKGDKTVTLPALKFYMEDETCYEAVAQYAYIHAGEGLDLTYVLPVELWQDGAFAHISSIKMTYETVAENAWKTTFGYENESAELEIKQISVTERILEQ